MQDRALPPASRRLSRFPGTRGIVGHKKTRRGTGETAMADRTLALGIVGLGNAGGALAAALAPQCQLFGFDIDPARRAAVGGLDITLTTSPTGVAENAIAAILSLPHPDISLAVADRLLAIIDPPELIIETGTITPKTAQALAAKCAARGVLFVDAAIAGGVQSMAAGQCTFLVGGDDAAVARARPILDLVAADIHHLGPVGAGSGAKIVNNAVMHAEMVILIEAAAMAAKLGIALPKLAEILGRPDGIMRPLEHRLAGRIAQGDYAGGMSVANALKDSRLALETAADAGVPLHAIKAAHEPYELARKRGWSNDDYASLARLWEEWCDVDFTAP
jgi:3-hydroxyisobutyrate dehydrogenase